MTKSNAGWLCSNCGHVEGGQGETSSLKAATSQGTSMPQPPLAPDSSVDELQPQNLSSHRDTAGINPVVPAATLKIKASIGSYMVFVVINLVVAGIFLLVPSPMPSHQKWQLFLYVQGSFLLLYAAVIPSFLKNYISIGPDGLTMLEVLQHKWIGKKVTIPIANIAFIRLGNRSYLHKALQTLSSEEKFGSNLVNAAGVILGATALGLPSGPSAAGAAAAEETSVWLIVGTRDGQIYGSKTGTFSTKDLTALVGRLQALRVDVQFQAKEFEVKIVDASKLQS